MIAEWGYNLMESITKYQEDKLECRLFRAIINGEMEESVMNQIQQSIEALKSQLEAVDLEIHQTGLKGFIPRPALLTSLRIILPDKSSEQFNFLSNALENDQQGHNVSYRWLFEADGDSMFLDEIRSQEYASISQYVESFSAFVAQQNQNTTLTAEEAERYLQQFDKNKPKYDIDRYLQRGFQTAIEHLNPKASIEKEKLYTNLKRGDLKMTK